MGGSGQSSKDQKANRNLSGKDQAWEVSTGEDCISCWISNDVCYDLAESLSAFCSYPETLPEIGIKGSGLINLIIKISRQSNV